RPEVDDRRQLSGSLFHDRHFKWQQAMPFDSWELGPGMLRINDLDARDAALAEHPIEFRRHVACGAGDPRAVSRHRQRKVRVQPAFATDLGAAGSDYNKHNPAAACRSLALGGAQRMLIEASAQAVLGAEHD